MRLRRSADAHRWEVLTGALMAAVLLSWGCGEPPAAPTLTAQGFELAQGREARIAELSSLRIRVEVPAGLESLRIRERSYDVDLARSPEPGHFPLFGLSQRIWSKADVTLDFGPYVLRKMTVAGDYEFDIAATDRNQQVVKAILRVRVLPAAVGEPGADPEREEEGGSPDAEPSSAQSGDSSAALPTAPLRSGRFRLERMGRGPVVSDVDFGIAWKTVESTHVVIRIAAGEGETSRFARLPSGAFAGIDSREALAEELKAIPMQPTLELRTANDYSAGAEVAIVRPAASYLLRTDHSETHLSDRGTTVILTGLYKR